MMALLYSRYQTKSRKVVVNPFHGILSHSCDMILCITLSEGNHYLTIRRYRMVLEAYTRRSGASKNLTQKPTCLFVGSRATAFKTDNGRSVLTAGTRPHAPLPTLPARTTHRHPGLDHHARKSEAFEKECLPYQLAAAFGCRRIRHFRLPPLEFGECARAPRTDRSRRLPLRPSFRAAALAS
jgi:hypothetical protein